MDITFTIENNDWIVSSKMNNEEIGYIAGSATHIGAAYVRDIYRGTGLCGEMLTIVFKKLDRIYAGSGGLEDDFPMYTIDMQGSDRMCYCLVKTSQKLNKKVYRDRSHREISFLDCGDNFQRGRYCISSI